MMNELEQPLYPKLSSIYNKILQLVSAILLIVVLLAFLIVNTQQGEQVLEQHFEQVADKFLHQAVSGVSVFLNEKSSSLSKKDRFNQLQSYLNNLASAEYIKQIHLYDETGLLLLKSELIGETTSSIKLLYGIDESLQTMDKSKQYIPFVKEIRNDSLNGYLRLTIEKSYLTSDLANKNSENQTLYRALLMVAGLVGFLLTRGLNRFSRQGYRAPKG